MARGDQIYCDREFLSLQGVYEHHGLDCGDGTVIHYRKLSETIERTSLKIFTGENRKGENRSIGNKIYERSYATSFTPEVVMRRATSRLGEKNYNLLFNNCEHFATWCKTGVSESSQVQDILPVLSTMNPDELATPIREALRGNPPENSQVLLDRAIAQIKVTWNSLQPDYKHNLKEAQEWQQVAAQALKKNREDLARSALQKKLSFQKQANAQKAQLEQLATMTQTLLQNHQ